jgi:anti-sigma factor RsiW
MTRPDDRAQERHDGGAGEEHARVWPLLPWYVNGTLSPAEVDAIERHLAGCTLCRGELALLSATEGELRGLSVLEESMLRNLDALHDRLDAAEPDAAEPDGDRPAAGPPPAGRRGHGWRRTWRDTPLAMRAALGVQTAVVATFVAFLVIGPRAELPSERFRLSSEALPTVAAPAWRVRFDGQARTDALNGLLGDLGLTIVHGPSATGIYTLVVADRGADAGRVERIEAALARSPTVALVVPTP